MTKAEKILSYPRSIPAADVAAKCRVSIGYVRTIRCHGGCEARLAYERDMYRRKSASLSQVDGRREWSEHEDASLKALAGTCYASDIARQLRRSRNAVIGRAHRFGLSLAKRGAK